LYERLPVTHETTQCLQGAPLDLTEEKIAASSVEELRGLCQQLLAENQSLRDLISARTSAAIGNLREQGLKFNGNLPYGLGSDKVTKKLEPSRYEERLIAKIKQLHTQELSLRAIARTLTEHNLLNRDGKPIDAKQVARILDAAGVARKRRPIPSAPSVPSV
jgi:DNA invertase Pin-like site-specific DNA recombinase